MSGISSGPSTLLSTESKIETVVTLTDFASIVPVASTSFDTLSTTSFAPETVRPLPKAPPRKGNQINRRKVKSAVLADTPVKDELAAIEAARSKKKVK